jgi:hypothetical protein
VDRVNVSATRPGTQDRWDGNVADHDDAAICSLVAAGTRLLAAEAAEGVGLLCGFMRSKQPERDRRNPDLQVRLSAGSAVRFDSFVESDVLSHVFGYEFVVPTAAVPPDGLRFEVLDWDSGRSGEAIGVARVTLEMLAQALDSPAQLIDVPAGAVEHLELVIAPYTPLVIAPANLRASQGPLTVGGRQLAAGEIVMLRAQGSYTVGSWFDRRIGPRGYPLGKARGYNLGLEPFLSAPHGCGIALAGKNPQLAGALVAPEATFVAQYSGPLRVGLNDKDARNNRGWISFQGSTRAPKPEEWGRAL